MFAIFIAHSQHSREFPHSLYLPRGYETSFNKADNQPLPAECKLAAIGPALAKAFFISADVIASVVFRSVARPAAAVTITDVATPSVGPSVTAIKSYSPKVK